MKEKKKRRKTIWIIILIVFVISLPGYYCGLTVRKYEVEDARIVGTVRIALVTDLHSCVVLRYLLPRLNPAETRPLN